MSGRAAVSPGFRGVTGPAPAGATPPAGVRRVGIEALPALALRVLRAALQPLPAGMADGTGLFIRYVHRKPGRGLTVTCAVGAPREPAAPGSARPAPPRWITISIDEGALEGARIRFSAQDIQEVPPEGAVAGCVAIPSLGFAVQDFPSDRRLSSLAASLSTDLQDPLIGQLELAARACLLDPAWHIRRARAEPVRYKPGSRCVIRYELGLEKRSVNGAFRRELSLFGKVHGDPQRALAVHAAAEQLYAAHRQDGSHPIIPRPLGVAEALGLTLSEAISSDIPQEAPRTGLEVLRPRLRRGVGEPVARLHIPSGELRAVALALARLHTSGVSLPGPSRTAAKEALRAGERAALIATHCPLVADSPRRLARELASRLHALRPEAYAPAHGGFKPSRLLFLGERVCIVDLDGLCRADPALDVGYFLAYLRPSGLWYRRPAMRGWFAGAAATFLTAYRQAIIRRGIDDSTSYGIRKRARLYEAATLFKIAARRAHRLNSPRPAELEAILGEIRACMHDAH
ncbi:MAG: hypothetical protein E6K24_01825 [Gammaproteobacteria bacterium]|nr:MAG: hypothetical protein E6K24_01825 [Gammaproteobacteria bacterium]